MIQNEDIKTFRELIRVLERSLGLLDDEMSCCGVTLAQCHALVEIGRAGNISLIELSKLLNLDNSTLSRTVNNLVNSELAVRELNPEDRRYVSIKLTQSGLTAYEEIETKMEVYFDKILASIPEERQEQVLDSLQILLKAISETECCK